MKSSKALGLFPLPLLDACATIPPTSAQIASCKAMDDNMGIAAPHDHNETKGQGRNPMNLSHDRCLQILKQ